MTDHDKTIGPLDLPMQPTGSGVADLETSREQDALAADGDLADDADVLTPTEAGRDADASAAQPS